MKLVDANNGSEEKYVPLSMLDKVRLANHLEYLMEAFIQKVPTTISNY